VASSAEVSGRSGDCGAQREEGRQDLPSCCLLAL
jgi:hypothetical protein